MDELLRDFLTETGESLDRVDAELVRFEQEPNNTQILSNIFRLVHTIKGTCGFLALSRLERLTHAAESLMGKFRDGMPVTSDAVTLILATLDRVKSILRGIENLEHEPEGDDSDLIGRLGAMSGVSSKGEPARNEPVRREQAPAVAEAAREVNAPGDAKREQASSEPLAPEAAEKRSEGGEKISDRTRQPFDPRQRRYARSSDDDGVGAGADAQSAA